MNNTLSLENYIFYATLGFLSLLWFANLGNYLILSSFIIFFMVLNYKVKNYKLSLFLVTLTSSVVYIGKTYTIEILPAGSFNADIFPDSYSLVATFMPFHIFLIFMILVIARDIYFKNINLIRLVNLINILLLGHFVIIFATDLFVSRMPFLSTLLDLLFIGPLIIYFYLQIYGMKFKYFIKSLANIFYSLTFFESIIVFYQFALKSPIGKTIEVTRGMLYHPVATDELEFFYRPSGTFDHANVLALNLCIWLFFMVADFVDKSDRRKLIIIILGLLGLVVTLSRATWIGFLVGLMFMLFVIEKMRKKSIFPIFRKYKALSYICLVIGSLFMIYFVLPRALVSLNIFNSGGGQYRFEQLSDAWKIIKLNFWTGVGGNMFIPEVLDNIRDSVFYSIPFGIHNWYVSMVATYGIFSLLLALLFLYFSIRKLVLRLIISDKVNIMYLFNLGVVATFLAFIITGVFTGDSGFSYLLLFLGYVNRNNI